MYIIENANHEIIGKPLNTLAKVLRPDGGFTTMAKVDSELYDENDDGPYHIREVIEATEGSGSMRVEIKAPTYADGSWKRITKYKDPPDPIDAQGTDEDADGYDPEYADRYGDHREEAYNTAGVTTDAMIVAIFEKIVEDRGDAADALQVLRVAVKKRFPKPE